MHTRSGFSGVYPILYARLFARRPGIEVVEVLQPYAAATAFGLERLRRHARPLASCIEKAASRRHAFFFGWPLANE